MKSILASLQESLGQSRVTENVSLAPFTTFKVGGLAQFLYTAQTAQDLTEAVLLAHKLGIPVTVLGGGSNVVISDHGIEGLVIRNQSRSLAVTKRNGSIKNGSLQITHAIVTADSGVIINQLVRFTCDEGLAGLEAHLGLPGTVGGALYMNSKWTHPTSYTGDNVVNAQIITKDGEVKIVDKTYFDFAYDYSSLQKSGDIVISVSFLLQNEDPKVLWERAQESLAYRKQTQPQGKFTAGCTFQNISSAVALKLNTPNHTTSAGYLLDSVGLKNYKQNTAFFSGDHANFIINSGAATASDIYSLIQEGKKRVHEKYGIDLQLEAVLLGKFN